jgi:hypothetical protein
MPIGSENRLTGEGKKDVISGAFLVVLGIAVAFYSYESYNIGTIRQMGPGMFPLMLGCVLSGLGLLILTPGLLRMADPLSIKFEVAPFAAVIASILAFALMAERFGIVLSIVALTFLSSLADPYLNIRRILVLSAALSIMSVVVFSVLLNIRLPLVNWPF